MIAQVTLPEVTFKATLPSIAVGQFSQNIFINTIDAAISGMHTIKTCFSILVCNRSSCESQLLENVSSELVMVVHLLFTSCWLAAPAQGKLAPVRSRSRSTWSPQPPPPRAA